MTLGELVERVAGWLERLMPADDRRDQLVLELQQRFGADPTEVTAAACREVERVAWAYSRHLLLVFEPDGTDPADEVSKGWPPPDGEDIKRRAGGVGEVRRLAGGTALIRVDALDAVGPARPFVEAAVTLAGGAERIVLDLRGNGGGDPATLALIAGRLLGDEATKLSEVVYRDRRRQWWTPDLAPGTALTQPVAVLVGEGTFSSGEALAYHLQARGRVTVVGTRTPGAADHITPIRLGPSVLGLLPEAYVVDSHTGTNWEGRGVVPDVSCPADEALAAALRL
ncbi:S41 family peptidase [Actinoplanes sp. NPDC051470]|uniref:S41 family peptidase n=1 Tax=unclassified Actinoplanes TaxID=2626549 RepID=UPI00342BE1D0